jgi:hypothetical protein
MKGMMMDKKAMTSSGFKVLLGAIILIACLVLFFFLSGKSFGVIKESDRCANEYCVAPKDGCPDDRGETYYPSKLKCEDKALVCCTPASDPLSLEAKAREKEDTSADSPPSNQVANNGRIHIYMNDAITELPSSSAKNLDIGKSYSFKISAEGANADNCLVQILDKNDAKVTDASWIASGALGVASCTAMGTEARKITINPNSFSLNNERYKLEVALVDKSTSKVITYSSIDMTFVISDEPNNIVVTT